MKKYRLISLVLVLSLLMPVFALTACTDKTKANENKPRNLTAAEQLLVGTWRNIGDSSKTLTFQTDRTVLETNGTFKEGTTIDGEFRPDDRGPHHVYSVGGVHYCVFSERPDELCEAYVLGGYWHYSEYGKPGNYTRVN